MVYPACPLDNNGRKCQKKMRLNEDNGFWQCERHFDDQVPSVDWRYMFNIRVADYSGCLITTVFGDQGEKLFGKTAPELKSLLDDDFDAYENEIQSVKWRQYKFKLKVAEETYNDN
ncbi:hypothetical protein, partial [Pseudomonas aeruginosa]|uniref:hypothetical protein n=1 Tax=Pseudomonas aeruginosa TaxID=287 RepID=UPI0023E2A900